MSADLVRKVRHSVRCAELEQNTLLGHVQVFIGDEVCVTDESFSMRVTKISSCEENTDCWERVKRSFTQNLLSRLEVVKTKSCILVLQTWTGFSQSLIPDESVRGP